MFGSFSVTVTIETMRVAILGYAGQGKSAYEYWNQPENDLTICDNSDGVELPAGAKSQLGANYLQDLDSFDLLVRTPSLHPRDIVAANPGNPRILDKVTTNTNEFLRVCPSKNTIGVTGTKGKGTTCTLVAKMLEASGKRVHLGGNIGIPPLELLKDNIQPDNFVVLELANFHLIVVKHWPHIAVLLMFESEHIDWHTDFAEYVKAKEQMFTHQTAQDFAIYYGENQNSLHIAEVSPGSLVPYMRAPGATVEGTAITIGGQTICQLDELKLLGRHNWQNACAAVTALWQIEQNPEAARQVLTTFAGLAYRLELRKVVAGVRYYNDSYASAPQAAMAALEAIPGGKVMIVGGYERGLELNELAAAFKNHEAEIKKVIIIGQSGPRLSENLNQAGFTNYELSTSQNMDEIVKLAGSFAGDGDAVVLSPGFASFDMFKNFEDRGQQFNEALEKL